MSIKANIVWKETAGFNVTNKPLLATIIRGTHVKLEIQLKDFSNYPLNFAGYSVSLLFKKQDTSVLEIQSVPLNYTSGQADVTLLPADTSLLFKGATLGLVAKIINNVTPAYVTYVEIPAAITVIDASMTA